MPVTILDDPTYAPDPAKLGSPATITTRVKGKEGAVRCVYKLSDTNDLFFRAGGGTAKKVELPGQLTGAAGGEALAQKVTLVRAEGDRQVTQAFVTLSIIDSSGLGSLATVLVRVTP